MRSRTAAHRLVASSGSGSERMTCAFVPPKPKALTPAMRGPECGHGVKVVGTAKALPSQSTSGFGSMGCAWGEARDAHSARITPDDAGDSRSGLEGPDIGLHRADVEGTALALSFRKDVREGRPVRSDRRAPSLSHALRPNRPRSLSGARGAALRAEVAG